MKLLDLRKSELKNQADKLINEIMTFIQSGNISQSNISVEDFLNYRKNDVDNIKTKLDKIKSSLTTNGYSNFNIIEKNINSLKSLNSQCNNLFLKGKSKIDLAKSLMPIIRIVVNLLIIYLVVIICIAYYNWMMETGWGWFTIIVGWVIPLAVPMYLILWNLDDEENSFTFSKTIKPIVKSIIYQS